MRFWIVTLRILGTFMFLWGVVGGTVYVLQFFPFRFVWAGIYERGLPVLFSLALSVVCFALAAGLKTIQRTDQRIERATAARRARSVSPTRSIAPDAPRPANTAKFADAAEEFRMGQNYRR